MKAEATRALMKKADDHEVVPAPDRGRALNRDLDRVQNLAADLGPGRDLQVAHRRGPTDLVQGPGPALARGQNLRLDPGPVPTLAVANPDLVQILEVLEGLALLREVLVNHDRVPVQPLGVLETHDPVHVQPREALANPDLDLLLAALASRGLARLLAALLGPSQDRDPGLGHGLLVDHRLGVHGLVAAAVPDLLAQTPTSRLQLAELVGTTNGRWLPQELQ